jgi:hypothetical protein
MIVCVGVEARHSRVRAFAFASGTLRIRALIYRKLVRAISQTCN